MHLFLQSEIAASTWHELHSLMDLQVSLNSFSSLLLTWWSEADVSTVYHWLKLVVPAVALWSKWKSRNKCIFEGPPMRTEDILYNIKRSVFSLATAHKLSFPPGKTPQSSMTFFNLQSDYSAKPRILVRWISPPNAWLKFNCDGASRGNPGSSGGGGICRTSNGTFHIAFHEYFGMCSSMVAETRAVLSALQLLDFSVVFLWLELDSQTLVNLLLDIVSCPWQIHYYVRTIKELLSKHTYRITHVFREANTTSDLLANVAIELQSKLIYHSVQDLPKHIQGSYILDKASLPNLRKH